MDAKIIPMNKESQETISREQAKQILDNILTTKEKYNDKIRSSV